MQLDHFWLMLMMVFLLCDGICILYRKTQKLHQSVDWSGSKAGTNRYISYYKFSLQLYYIHKGSKPTCCTICLFICSQISNIFGQICWPSSWTHIQQWFNLELSNVVTAVILFKMIKNC
jgi:hypothetical protein